MSPVTRKSPATRAEQFAFLRKAHEGPDKWFRLCQSLTRQAAQLPAVAPSAAAAAAMVPKSLRVFDLADMRRGMAVFWGRPDDSNPSDHVTTLAGFTSGPRNLDHMLNWTNDAVAPGSVDLVRGSFFPSRWGVPLMFASPTLNGYWLPGFGPSEDPKPQPIDPAGIGANLDDAIRSIRKAIDYHERLNHPKRVKALREDLAELRETRKRFPTK